MMIISSFQPSAAMTLISLQAFIFFEAISPFRFSADSCMISFFADAISPVFCLIDTIDFRHAIRRCRLLQFSADYIALAFTPLHSWLFPSSPLIFAVAAIAADFRRR
jgi:hypothetical protein